MPNFSVLLISLCDIQGKSLAVSGYTTAPTWSTLFTSVPTRKDSQTGSSISDGQVRENTDDDVFFFNSDVIIKRGNRIIFSGETYDVIKVNPVYDSVGVHHLEVVARFTDHD